MTTPLGADKWMDQRIEQRDALHLTPEDRARLIFNFFLSALEVDEITNPLFWDLVCFCTEFLNIFALQSEDEQILSIAKVWNSLVYQLHYSLPNDAVQLGPDRETHSALWTTRTEETKDD